MAEEFYEEIKSSVSEINSLPGNLYVIAGFVKARTNLSLSIILPFLRTFHSFEGEDSIEDVKSAFLKSMLLGNLAEAKLLLTKMKMRSEVSLSSSVSVFNVSKEEPVPLSPSMSTGNIREDNNFPILRKIPTRQPENEETPNPEKASEDLIKKIMEEEQQIPGRKSIDIFCGLCEQKLDNSCIFLECGHMFHKRCLSQELQYQIENGHSSLTCPLDTHKIAECDIRDCLDPDWVERFQKNSISNYMKNQHQEIIFPCPLCQGLLQAKQMVNKFNCPNCKKEVCLKCKSRYHRGLTCEEANIPCPRCQRKGLTLNGDRLTCECGIDICLRCREEKCACMDES